MLSEAPAPRCREMGHVRRASNALRIECASLDNQAATDLSLCPISAVAAPRSEVAVPGCHNRLAVSRPSLFR